MKKIQKLKEGYIKSKIQKQKEGYLKKIHK